MGKIQVAAIHEAGHAIVALHLGCAVHRIKIEPPRGVTDVDRAKNSFHRATILVSGFVAESLWRRDLASENDEGLDYEKFSSNYSGVVPENFNTGLSRDFEFIQSFIDSAKLQDTIELAFLESQLILGCRRVMHTALSRFLSNSAPCDLKFGEFKKVLVEARNKAI